MKASHRFTKGPLDRAISNEQKSPFIPSSMKTKMKMLLPIIVLSHLFFSASFSQDRHVFLTKYDSCQVRTSQEMFTTKEAFSVGSPLVRVAYVIPSNRTAQPNGVAYLQNAIKIGQQWYKDQMEQNGFGAKTYVFETEADGVTPLIHVVPVTETDDFLRGDIWPRTTQAVTNAGISIWASGELWVLIPEAHLMQADGTVIGGTAQGAGFGSGDSPGVAMIGSNALPLFQPGMITDDTPYDGKVVPALGPFPMKQGVTFASFEGSTFSSLASSWLGALLHEMGHALGLAHDYRNDTNFHGNLMFNGFRGIRGSLFPEKYPQDYTRLAYSSSTILNVSHYFNRDKIVTSSPDITYANFGSVIPQQGHVHITFQASDSDSLSLALLRYRGDAVAEMALEGTDVDTTFAVPYFTQGSTNPYTIAVYDKQGNLTNYSLEFNVPGGYNQAPVPFIRVDPPMPGPSQLITLNASISSDVDHDQSSLVTVWDVDNDGKLDTQPSTNKTIQYQYENPGNYLIRLKIIDPDGAQTISTPVSIKIPGEQKIAIESFSLIDADKDEAVAELRDSMEIDLGVWMGKLFSIRANTSPGTIERVELNLTGPISHQQIEKKQPYALFGDSPDGNFIGRKLVPGQYTLTATPFSSAEKGTALTISFRVIDTRVITSLTLINPRTDHEIKELKHGDVVNLKEVGSRRFDIRANIADEKISKVVFQLKGPIKHQQIERMSPYTLFGDHHGHFNGRKWLAGAYTLTVTPYINDVKETALTISFVVTDGFAINSFTLIDATLDQPISILSEGDIIDLSLLKNNKLSVRADTEPVHVDKVFFTLNGPIVYFWIERYYPYTLFGDITSQNGSTDYAGLKLICGSYTLTATAYSDGVWSSTHAISFEVTTGGQSDATSRRLEVYPIPASGVINITHEGKTEQSHMILLDLNGNVLLNRHLSKQPVEQLDVSAFRKGTYYLKVVSPEGVQVIRLVLE
ncbi:MAG TPA: T9SS type A sorting domain-containing protein [Chryseolinea sp.]|nr:T9SS type A sorting domain-containing protein [Chryseolinea sp.]